MESLFDAELYTANWYALPYFITGLLSLAVAVAVCLREKIRWNTAAFFLLILTAVLWLFCYCGMALSADKTTAMIWSRLHSSFIILIPYMALLFSLTAVQRLKAGLPYLAAAGILSASFIAMIWYTPWYLGEPRHFFWGYYSHYKPLSFAFLSYFFIVLLACLLLFRRERLKTSSPLTRRRMKLFFKAFLIAYFASVDYAGMYGMAIYPFGYLPFFAGLSLLAFGILRYRLADITPSYAADQIIKTMADALLVIDRENTVRVANQKAVDLFSRSGKGLVGSRISETGIPFFHASSLKRLIEIASIQTHEISFPGPEGGEVFIELSTSVIRTGKGDGVAVVCIAKDITERKQAEQALKERELHYRILAENVTDIIWTMSPDFRFTYISPSVHRIRGYTPEEAVAQSLDETFVQSSHLAAFRTFSELFSEAAAGGGEPGAARTIELEYRCRDGSALPVEIKVSLLRGRSGMPDQLLGISRDITEREIARKNLEITERHYRELIQTLDDPILTLDRHGFIVSLNRAAENLFGLSKEEAAGVHITKAGLIAEHCLPDVINEFTNIIIGRGTPSFVIQMMRRGGSVLPLSASTRILRRDKEHMHIEIHLKALREEAA